MPGPPPKDPKLRQRRNKVATATTLVVSNEEKAAPASTSHDLPPRQAGEIPWHPETLVFWKEVWASPMAAEFIAADIPGLVLVARLIDRFNYGDVALAGEIRLQRQCFGLTPLDRRRLQWEIERAESAGRRRPATGQPAIQQTGVRDPRRTLRAVK